MPWVLHGPWDPYVEALGWPLHPAQGWLPRSEDAPGMSSPQELDRLAFLHARMERSAYCTPYSASLGAIVIEQ